MPIPIYRLPILVTKIIVDCVKEAELLSISLCSKRVGRVLKACGKKDISYFNLTYMDLWDYNTIGSLELFLMEAERTDKTVLKERELNLKLRVSDDTLSVEIVSEGNLDVELTSEHISKMDQYIGDRKDLRFDDVYVPTIRTSDWKVYTFWDQMAEGLLGLVNYLIINFKCSVDLYLKGDGPIFFGFIRKVTQYTIQPHVTIRDASLTACQQKIADEDFKFILENLKVTGKFEIHVETSKDFRFDGKIQASCLIFTKCSTWFTLRHLLNGDFERVGLDIGDHVYPASEVNWFLKEWMAGKLPKLKNLNFVMDKFIDELTLPEGWVDNSKWDFLMRLHHVYKFDGVIGDRNVTARIFFVHRSGKFVMQVDHGEGDQENGEEDNEDEEDGEDDE